MAPFFSKRAAADPRNETQVNAQELLTLYNSAQEEGLLFLKKCCTRFTKDQQQEIINRLQEQPSYGDLLQNPSQSLCSQVEATANPVYFGATPISIRSTPRPFAGFFNPSMTSALANRPCHNDFDSFNQWDLWLEPFGFNTQFNNEPDPLKFDQYTVGIAAGGEYTFSDRLVLGLGLAYSHSGIDWKKIEDRATLNSLYFGPALGYVFSHGYLGCTLFGVANFYQIHRKTDLFPALSPPEESTLEDTNWDLVLRLEGGLSLRPGHQIYLYPILESTILLSLKNGVTEQLEEDTELVIEGMTESFLTAKAGVKMAREFYTESFGFVIPSLSFGYLGFSPSPSRNINSTSKSAKTCTAK